jgi:hypothetical protein
MPCVTGTSGAARRDRGNWRKQMESAVLRRQGHRTRVDGLRTVGTLCRGPSGTAARSCPETSEAFRVGSHANTFRGGAGRLAGACARCVYRGSRPVLQGGIPAARLHPEVSRATQRAGARRGPSPVHHPDGRLGEQVGRLVLPSWGKRSSALAKDGVEALDDAGPPPPARRSPRAPSPRQARRGGPLGSRPFSSPSTESGYRAAGAGARRRPAKASAS